MTKYFIVSNTKLKYGDYSRCCMLKVYNNGELRSTVLNLPELASKTSSESPKSKSYLPGKYITGREILINKVQNLELVSGFVKKVTVENGREVVKYLDKSLTAGIYRSTATYLSEKLSCDVIKLYIEEIKNSKTGVKVYMNCMDICNKSKSYSLVGNTTKSFKEDYDLLMEDGRVPRYEPTFTSDVRYSLDRFGLLLTGLLTDLLWDDTHVSRIELTIVSGEVVDCITYSDLLKRLPSIPSIDVNI